MARKKGESYLGGHTVAGRKWFSHSKKNAQRQLKLMREGDEAHQRFLGKASEADEERRRAFFEAIENEEEERRRASSLRKAAKRKPSLD